MGDNSLSNAREFRSKQYLQTRVPEGGRLNLHWQNSAPFAIMPKPPVGKLASRNAPVIAMAEIEDNAAQVELSATRV
jgi:hypothetical protein